MRKTLRSSATRLASERTGDTGSEDIDSFMASDNETYFLCKEDGEEVEDE